MIFLDDSTIIRTDKQCHALNNWNGLRCRKNAFDNSDVCSFHRNLGTKPESWDVCDDCGEYKLAGKTCKNCQLIESQGLRNA